MVISRKRTPPTPIHLLMPNDQVLQQVSSYKYLGILLTSDLSLSAHINLKVRRIVGLLYRQFSNASSHTIVTLYNSDSLVRPQLEYACPVWSLHLAKDINALEKVQRFACRVALGTWDLSCDQLLIWTGSLPTLAARRRYLQQSYLFRIVHG